MSGANRPSCVQVRARVRRRRAAMSRILPILGALLVAGACSEGAPESTGASAWVGTITTEGNVTTVINESGSVWGGTARLVEEASIGVDVGAEEYMLGEVSAMYATDDEIYLIDRSSSQVRVYDFDGNHLRSFGRGGQGPGEIGDFPFDITVDDEGRVYVGDIGNRRINIYTADGERVDEIPFPSQAACCRLRLVFAEEGGLWMHERLAEPGSPTRGDGVRRFTRDGPVGETRVVPQIEYDRRVVNLNGREINAVPFAAALVWNLSYDGSLVVGASDSYAFRIIRPDGETTMVERYWDPVPVGAEEADYWRRLTRAQLARAPDLSWNGENIPDHKPAFATFMPSPSGELWVVAHGPVPPGACSLAPEEMANASDPGIIQDCMLGDTIVDVFGADGRYLGNVEGLPNILVTPFVDGDTLVAATQDEAGTVMVKRYRLQLPPGAGRP